MQLMKGGAKPPQGLRIMQKKFTILRNFTDDEVDAYTVYGKKVRLFVVANSLVAGRAAWL